MSSGARVVGGIVSGAAGLALAAAVLHAGDSTYTPPSQTERLLYLRSGKVADRVMLSFDSIAADVYWIRAIQHFGRDFRHPPATGRFELLQPLLDLTTTLDPHFNIAYRFGALFLSMDPPASGMDEGGPGRPDQAIALLEKGLENNPTRWQYAFDIGFVHYWHSLDGSGRPNFAAAAAWFKKAAAMPNAPNWLPSLAAITLAQGGNRRDARKMLGELASSSEKWISGAAQRTLLQLDALDQIERLQALADQFYAERNVWPGLLDRDPTGTPYEYDSAHRVILSPRSTLNPLPQMLAK